MIRGNKTNSGPSNTNYSLWEGYAYFLWWDFCMCVCVRARIASYLTSFFFCFFFISPCWNKCSSGFLSVMGHHMRTFLRRWRRPRRGCEELWWEERSFMWCFETHYAPPDEGNIGGGSVGGMTSVKQQRWRARNYDCMRDVHGRGVGGVGGENCKQIAEAEHTVVQGWLHLHETLSRAPASEIWVRPKSDYG